MTLHTYLDLEQRSEEWLALRCGIPTASVIGQLVTHSTPHALDVDCPACGAILGPCIGKRTGSAIKTVHPERAEAARNTSPVLTIADNATVRSLAAFLAAERIAGVDPDGSFLTRDMFRGVLAEDPAREKYARHYGVTVEACGLMLLEEDAYSIGVSPDGLVGDDGGIEIKSPRQKGHVLTATAGQVPGQHMAQIQTALLVSGRKWWDFISYSPGLRMWVKRVTPDPEWFRAIRAAVAALEVEVAQIVRAYHEATDGFPMTERIDYSEEVELKL